ncbi:MAG: SEC-C metal-binding domain-containing protein [Planctomycetota bacterium]
MSALLFGQQGCEDAGVYPGIQQCFDGYRFRYAAEGVAHLKELIAREPQRSFLWVRLGNVYYHGDCPREAEQAYRRAVELDAEDVEAHYALADLLMERHRPRKAAPHWKAVLQHVRDAGHLQRDVRSRMVSMALGALLDTLKDPNEAFESLTRAAEDQADAESREPVVLELREFDLGKQRDWDQICALFLGERLKPRYPELHRRLSAPALPQLRIERGPQFCGGPPVPRNAPCPCGSGHKYKKCCGRP